MRAIQTFKLEAELEDWNLLKLANTFHSFQKIKHASVPCGRQLCFYADILIVLPTKRPTVYERRYAVYGLNQTDFWKSTVLAFLYCFEKSLESFEFWQETFTTAIHTNFPRKMSFRKEQWPFSLRHLIKKIARGAGWAVLIDVRWSFYASFIVSFEIH